MGIDELQRLVKELRDKVEEKGRTEAELKELQERLNTRIDELEARIMRPPLGDVKNTTPNEHKEVFIKYIRKGKNALGPEEQKALVEDPNTAEALVPADYAQMMFEKLAKQVYIRKLATVIRTTSSRVRIPILTRPNFVSWGKLEIQSQQLEETYGFGIDGRNIEIKDLYGLVKIGEDLLSDIGYPLENMLLQGFVDAFAQAQEQAYLFGDGYSPSGVINSQFQSGNRIPTAQPGVVGIEDMFILLYKLPPQYRMDTTGVAFLMHPTVEAQLRTAKDPATGAYLWQPAVAAATPSTFAGYPVYASVFMPDPSASESGVPLVIFGNFKRGYMIVDRQDITVQRLNELFATEGKIGIKVHMRTGADVIDPFAFAMLTN